MSTEDPRSEHRSRISEMQGVNDEILCRIDLLKSLQESFICKRCGDCCTKQESIAFTERDIKNVSNKKNLSPQEFIERYGLGLVSNPGNLEFYRLPTRTIGGCPFYSDKACSIYDSRPQVCRGFPFLTPENVQNAFEMNGVIVLGGVCNAAIDQVERVLKNSGKQPDVVTRKPRSGTYIILL